MKHYKREPPDESQHVLQKLDVALSPTTTLLSRQPLVRVDEQMIRSYFYATYQWAPIWEPMLRESKGGDLRPLSELCSLAVVYGCAGAGLKAKAIQLHGHTSYTAALGQVQSVVSRAVKPELAQIIPILLTMAMYNVGHPPTLL